MRSAALPHVCLCAHTMGSLKTLFGPTNVATDDIFRKQPRCGTQVPVIMGVTQMADVAKLIMVTPRAEGHMEYVARVSNPEGQSRADDRHRLLAYCLKHQHWSVFEHAYMTVEIVTSVAIATQLLRHRSFVFQQFSQRYASADKLGFTAVHLRMQDATNRQNSVDACPPDVQAAFQARIAKLLDDTKGLYADMLAAGVAKECARGVLPQCTRTRVEMTGNCRSWIHYLQLRTAADTQKEHRDVALAIQRVFCDCFPAVAAALGW